MPSTFGGYEIARRGLQVSQGVMQVVGQNVANVNTPGYTRQRANISETDPITVGGVTTLLAQLGTGVQITDIQRVQDGFVNTRLQDATADQGELNQMKDLLDRVQNAYNEPGSSGLNSLMTAFFNSFNDLSQNPENLAIRTTVRENAENLVKQFQTISQSFDQIQTDIETQLKSKVTTVNDLSKQIASLNVEIRASVANHENPNDLMDRRDSLINQIVTLTGAKASPMVDNNGKPTGEINVMVGGQAIVYGDTTQALPSKFEMSGSTPQLVYDNGQRINLGGGEVAGMVKASNNLTGYRKQLDNVASTIIQKVNDQHKTGYGLDGNSGRNFFAGSNASNIQLDSSIEADVNAIAAATPPQPPATFASGNGDNARAIADLSNAKSFGLFTIGEYYNASMSQVAADAQAADRSATNQESVLNQLQSLRDSVSGVNLDEELTQMLQFQRSYQASARLLNVMDSMTEQIITSLGK